MIEFLQLFSLFEFFRSKTCHYKLVIAFDLIHEWFNGFHKQLDQARNFPFGLTDHR